MKKKVFWLVNMLFLIGLVSSFTGCSFDSKEDTIKKYYTKEKFTEIKDTTSFKAFFNESKNNDDIFVTGYKNKPIEVKFFKNDELIKDRTFEILSSEAPPINFNGDRVASFVDGNYVYSDKKWYINTNDMKSISKEKAINEINLIIEKVNSELIKIENNRSSWIMNKVISTMPVVIPPIIAIPDGKRIKISENEKDTAIIVDGKEICRPDLFIGSQTEIPCTEFETKDGTTKGVSLYSNQQVIQEIWTVKNDNGSIYLIRPNGYATTVENK